MNFDQFLQYKKKLLDENPLLIDLSETNLYDFFKELKNEFENSEKINQFLQSNPKFYRCHTVESYLEQFKLPPHWKEYVGASLGVRQSLSEVIFKSFKNIIIPKDVYPFYEKSSNIATYNTINKNRIFQNLPDGELLICYPMKPNSRELDKEDFNDLTLFLQKKSSNKIIFDMVYLTNWKIPLSILDLYKSNQVIILHSLSKTFLIPNHFGITLLPQNNEGKCLYLKFKELAKNESKLIIANFYIKNKNSNEYRKKINDIIVENGIFLEKKHHWKINPNSYLNVINFSFKELINNNILAIPVSVFGSDLDVCIVSSLIKK